MKLLSLAALSLLLCFSFLSASPPDPKGDAKITKNEAEHIALMRYPGARVTAAKLDKVKGRLVWLIEIAPAEIETGCRGHGRCDDRSHRLGMRG